MAKDTTSEHLRAELKNLADTLEEVLSSTGEKSKTELDKLRQKAREALDTSRERLGESVGWRGYWCRGGCGHRHSAFTALMMSDSQQSHGPGKGVINIGQRIVTTLVSIVETRVRLAVVELEEEKANLIQMLMMVGLTMLFTAFGLMSLMVLIIWAVDAQYRLMAIAITTAVLFLLALIFGVWSLRKSRQSTLRRHTRKELETDRKLLEEHRS